MNVTVNRRRALAAGLVLAGALLAPIAGHAQSYPTKPIKLVNPFAPGGTADVIGRSVAASLSVHLGQPVVVENVGGAGGVIGSAQVANAQPDGYTLLLSNVASQSIAPSLYAKTGYDSMADFEHVGYIGSMPNALVVHPSFPAKDLQQLLALAKAANPPLAFGSAGNGSTPHLSAELLKVRGEFPAEHIPFKGSGPALIALMGNQHAFQFENMSTAVPQIKAGKVRALAVTSATRVAALPDVPTMEEQGLKGYVVETWYGLSAPAKTPAAIVNALNTALNKALNDPVLQKRLADVGVTTRATTPAAYRDIVASEMKKWGEVVRVSKAKVD
jgi:tripartite-type tricarboxylate transporter receptor subunit TctC